jgi:L-fuculose-phosphate aldolase
MSLTEERIMPIDEEGKHYSPEGIAVVEARNAIGTEESAQIVSEALQNSTGVILRGHGMFARGESLEEAAKIISSAEHSARILMNYLMYHRMK